MISFLSNIFGTREAVDNIVNKDNGLLVRVGGWVNDLNYTDAERAKAVQETREWGIRQLDALAPFKVVQRILAFAATLLWIVVGLNVLLAIWIQAVYPDLNVIEPMIQFALSDYVWMPVVLCYGLYFGGGTIESFRRTKTKPVND